MILLVTGGRDFRDELRVREKLEAIKDEIEILVVGDCKTGVDLFARRWAHAQKINHLVAYARWDQHERAAGPIRNSHLVDYAQRLAGDWDSVLVLAFPGGTGTEDCATKSLAAGLSVEHV